MLNKTKAKAKAWSCDLANKTAAQLTKHKLQLHQQPSKINGQIFEKKNYDQTKRNVGK